MMDYKRKCYWENIKLLVLQDVSHQVNQDITRIRSLHSPIIQGLSLQCSVRASWRELHVCRPLGYCQVNINLMIDYARAKHKCNRLTTCILWIWMSPYGVEKRLLFFDVEARVIIINRGWKQVIAGKIGTYIPIQVQDACDSEIYELKQSFCSMSEYEY